MACIKVINMDDIFTGCSPSLNLPDFYIFFKIFDLNIENTIYFEVMYKSNENKGTNIKIFDKTFINNNRDKCKIIYKNKIYQLKEYLEELKINHNYKDSIKLI